MVSQSRIKVSAEHNTTIPLSPICQWVHTRIQLSTVIQAVSSQVLSRSKDQELLERQLLRISCDQFVQAARLDLQRSMWLEKQETCLNIHSTVSHGHHS